MHRLLTGPQSQELPVGYRWLVLKGLVDLCPWYLIEEQEDAEIFRGELLREIASPNISLIEDWFPFARRYDCDDFAGFVIEEGNVKPEVVVVHLTFTRHPRNALHSRRCIIFPLSGLGCERKSSLPGKHG
jgi:hypothetical protein